MRTVTPQRRACLAHFADRSATRTSPSPTAGACRALTPKP